MSTFFSRLKFWETNKYKNHPEAIIISCFFNPQNSPYRIMAFNKFYDSIKHVNHKIIECVIGDAQPQLPENENIKRVYTENLLWHKESLLNNLISELPAKYKYIFWVDADVIFTNKNWFHDGAEELKSCNIIQPFDWCIHLDKDQFKPEFDVNFAKAMYKGTIVPSSRRIWKSFTSTYVENRIDANSDNYDVHGHVGFAWGARRDVLERVPLYDKALIGGADHIMAHAAAGQIPCKCITKSFTDDIEEVSTWSQKFFNVIRGKISFVKGDLYHIWHGDISKRDYLKRIQDFTAKSKGITEKDENGLYVTKKGDDAYVKNYFKQREVTDDRFAESVMLGYVTNDPLISGAITGNWPGAMLGAAMNNSENESNSDNNVNQNNDVIDNNDNSNNHSDTTNVSNDNNYSETFS